jgi:preprotein translocase subunit SecY
MAVAGDRLHRVHGARAAARADPVSQAPGGQPHVGGEASHLPLKINTSGVIPPIFASSLLLMPATMRLPGPTCRHAGPSGCPGSSASCARPAALHALYVLLIVFFCFFYTSVVFNPDETADNLRKYGGFLPGIRPGKNTAEYLDYVLTRLTVIGAAYSVRWSASCRRS